MTPLTQNPPTELPLDNLKVWFVFQKHWPGFTAVSWSRRNMLKKQRDFLVIPLSRLRELNLRLIWLEISKMRKWKLRKVSLRKKILFNNIFKKRRKKRGRSIKSLLLTRNLKELPSNYSGMSMTWNRKPPILLSKLNWWIGTSNKTYL